MNRTRLRMLIFPILAILGFAAFGSAALPVRQQVPAEITVSAAISLKDSLEELARIYSTERPNVKVRFNFGASGTLQQQIEQGAPVDVFISASPAQMNALDAKGLIDKNTRKDMVRNRVVLIVPKGKTGVASLQDLTRSDVKVIAIGEPRAVPAGKYAQEVLTHMGLWDQLKPKFVLAKDVRQVLTYVATGNADAGIVYVTDALTSKDVSVVATAPEDSHAPVIYPVAAIKNSHDAAAAKDFVNFLVSVKARAVFEKYGFISPGC